MSARGAAGGRGAGPGPAWLRGGRRSPSAPLAAAPCPGRRPRGSAAPRPPRFLSPPLGSSLLRGSRPSLAPLPAVPCRCSAEGEGRFSWEREARPRVSLAIELPRGSGTAAGGEERQRRAVGPCRAPISRPGSRGVSGWPPRVAA